MLCSILLVFGPLVAALMFVLVFLLFLVLLLLLHLILHLNSQVVCSLYHFNHIVLDHVLHKWTDQFTLGKELGAAFA